jgi:hypothetical protein
MEKLSVVNINLKKAKESGNFYFRHGSSIVIVDALVAAKWDDLDTVHIDTVKYEKSRNESGELVDQPWERLEVVGFTNPIAGIAKKTRVMEAKDKFQTVFLSYQSNRQKAVKEANLSAEAVKELEDALNF